MRRRILPVALALVLASLTVHADELAPLQTQQDGAAQKSTTKLNFKNGLKRTCSGTSCDIEPPPTATRTVTVTPTPTLSPTPTATSTPPLDCGDGYAVQRLTTNGGAATCVLLPTPDGAGAGGGLTCEQVPPCVPTPTPTVTAVPTETVTPTSTKTPTPTLTTTPTPTPHVCPTAADGSGGLYGDDTGVGGLCLPTTTATSTPAGTRTATPTITPTAHVCPTANDGSGGLYGDDAGVGGRCLPTTTATATPAGTVTPTPTRTSTPWPCPTLIDAAGRVSGGLDCLNADTGPCGCLPTATVTATPAGTVTPTPTRTSTPWPCPTVVDASGRVSGGLDCVSADTGVCGCLPTATVTATPAGTATVTPTITATPHFCPTAADGSGGLYCENVQSGPCGCLATTTATATPPGTQTPTPTPTVTPTITVTPVGCPAGQFVAVFNGNVAGPTPTCMPAQTPGGPTYTFPFATVTPLPTCPAGQAWDNFNHCITVQTPGPTGTPGYATPTPRIGDGTNTFSMNGTNRILAGANMAVACSSTAGGVDCTLTSSATITAGFDLYVDKTGTDSGTCGPINAKCATIAGAHAIIATANDNGFATCSGNNTVGCGRCSTTTSTQCNQTSDCPGGETCTATNSVCSGLSIGTCTGPIKSYTIHIAPGDYTETVVPAAPGYITYQGVAQLSRVLSSASCTFDVSNRIGIGMDAMNIQNIGSGNALCSTAASTFGKYVNSGFVHWGAGWDVNFAGEGNITNSFLGILTLGYSGSASANSFYFEARPTTCSNDATRACVGDGNCAGGGTCTRAASGDLAVSGAQVQGGLGSVGGDAVYIEGKGCGTAFNVFLDNLTINAGNGGTQTARGLRVGTTSCNASGFPTTTQTRVLVRRVSVMGTDTSSGYLPLDASVSVEGAGTKIVPMGPFTYNACTRSIVDGGIDYTLGGANGGGPADLGVLGCLAPVNPQNGESWSYDGSTATPTPTTTAVTPTPTKTATPAATATATISPTPTATATPAYANRRWKAAGKVYDAIGPEDSTTSQMGAISCRDTSGTERLRISETTALGGRTWLQTKRGVIALVDTNGNFLWDCSGSTGRCSALGDPTNPLEGATKQYVDNSIQIPRATVANTAGTAVTLASGGATIGATNKAAGDVTIKTGIPTGTGSAVIDFQEPNPIATPGSTGDKAVIGVWRIRDGHLVVLTSTGTAPTVSSCGSSPVQPTGTDAAGKFTVGTGSTTSCTVTFAKAFTTNAPACVLTSSDTSGPRYALTTTTSAMTITTSTSMASSVINYVCIGVE